MKYGTKQIKATDAVQLEHLMNLFFEDVADDDISIRDISYFLTMEVSALSPVPVPAFIAMITFRYPPFAN